MKAAGKPSPEEQQLVKQAEAEEKEAQAHTVPVRQARLYWSIASLWFAAAVAAQNRFRFLVWGVFMNRAKKWVRKAQESELTAQKL